MFRNTRGRGVHFSFENGYMVSVQWGVMNYCSNRSTDFQKYEKELNTKAGDSFIESDTAEVAILNEKGDWVTKDVWQMIGRDRPNEDVIGHLSTDEVIDLLYLVKNF